MKSLALLLAHANSDQVNTCVSSRDLRTPLHLACSTGNLAVAQLLIWVSGGPVYINCVTFVEMTLL